MCSGLRPVVYCRSIAVCCDCLLVVITTWFLHLGMLRHVSLSLLSLAGRFHRYAHSAAQWLLLRKITLTRFIEHFCAYRMCDIYFNFHFVEVRTTNFRVGPLTLRIGWSPLTTYLPGVWEGRAGCRTRSWRRCDGRASTSCTACCRSSTPACATWGARHPPPPPCCLPPWAGAGVTSTTPSWTCRSCGHRCAGHRFWTPCASVDKASNHARMATWSSRLLAHIFCTSECRHD